ncbi:MAG: response regulator, partial [Thiovulaceae bacterium]|nr:response regulator [Sulfurimonadaceae bacterium]
MSDISDLVILYIDDEEAIRRNAVEYLNFHFREVHEASDGLQGYEVYKNISPDVIITDIQMPKLNGLEMIQKIRQTDQSTKIIVATAFLDPEYLLLAVELGLIKYLIKPITEDKLMPVLKRCLKFIEERNSIFKIDCKRRFDLFNRTLFEEDQQIE